MVIGGGIAGLGAAFKIKRAQDEGHDVRFTLVEKEPRLGGKIITELVKDEWGGSEDDYFIVDGGPDCFLTEKPAAHRIAKLTGVFDEELPTDDSKKKTWILSRGKLHQLPDGVMMFAPTKFTPFATTGLFSFPGKLRMGLDLLIRPKIRWAEGESAREHDETLESFVVRRMGRECLERLAEPLVGGVHASDPAMMSLAATFPRLLEMEQRYGSMIGGFLAASRKAAEMRKKYSSAPGAKPRTFFTSFSGGMQTLIDAMASSVGTDRIALSRPVTSLDRSSHGWVVNFADGSSEDVDAVIIATESWAAEPLLRPVDSTIAEALTAIPSSSSATVSLGFRVDETGIDLNAFGVLCPNAEGRLLMAATYSSSKWPGRAPEGKALLRGFVGGPHNQYILQKSDAEPIAIVTLEMREILGVKGAPLFSKVYRWERGMPQYTLGHLDRVESIEQRLAGILGLALAGGSYRGVGLPNCIESGERAAVKVLAEWGICLAEDATEEKRYY